MARGARQDPLPAASFVPTLGWPQERPAVSKLGNYILVLDKIVDKVLAYRPKPKSRPGKKRKRLAAKIARGALSGEAPGTRKPD